MVHFVRLASGKRMGYQHAYMELRRYIQPAEHYVNEFNLAKCKRDI